VTIDVQYRAVFGGEIPMLTSSRYVVNASPRCCMFCGEPFRPRDGYVEFWRTSAGQHFCSEFCADDAEEAQFRKRRAAAATPPGLVAGSPHL
jgi:ribosomal protein L24E